VSDETPLPTLPLAVVLDDNLMFAMMLEPQLRKLGHRVQTLGGGPNLAHRLAAAQPDLILVNLTSTQINGPEIIHALRALPDLAKAGIIGYAGHEESSYFHAALDAGADMVMPNSAIKGHLPKVLAKLAKLKAGEAAPDDDVSHTLNET
jgi:CheY-like chemotaxis protein